MRPFVSVIIPVFNDCVRLGVCLAALQRQSYPKDRIEIIVVDNGSNNGIELLAKQYPFVVLISEAEPGSYSARNTGIAHAQGEIVVFTDADCIPDNDWIEKGVNRLTNTPGCGLVTGDLELFFKDPQKLTPVELFLDSFSEYRESVLREVQWGATANIFTYREVINRVGRFNEVLKSGGDQEWGNRIFFSGLKLVHDPEVRVKHPARSSFFQFCSLCTRVIGGQFYLKKYNGKFWKVIILEPSSLNSRFQNDSTYLMQILRSKRYRKVEQKCSILLVWVLVKGIKVIEIIRLSCGGQPRR